MAFPGLPSYQRFIEWMPSTLISLCAYLKLCFSSCTGIGFVDASSLKVCQHDRGYVSQKLATQLLEDLGIQFFAKPRRNMKNKLMCLHDKLLSRLDWLLPQSS